MANSPIPGIEPLSENVTLDDYRDIATVYGVRISGGLFRALGEPTPEGRWLRVVKVDDGVATLEQRTDLAPRSEWIAALERSPSDHQHVLGWITGGSLHHDED